jgi:serine protease
VFLNVVSPLPLPVTEVEPNNTLALAQFVTVFPSQVSGRMESFVRSERSDTDYFRITLAAGKTLTAELRPNPDSDYNLEILDASGMPIASSLLGTGQLDIASASNPGAAPVTVYVRISYASGLKGPTGTYTLLLMQP